MTDRPRAVARTSDQGTYVKGWHGRRQGEYCVREPHVIAWRAGLPRLTGEKSAKDETDAVILSAGFVCLSVTCGVSSLRCHV